ncbi:deoxyribodipyrimidine photolyase-related protein [Vibrio crassostreae]|uniref:Putative deoxyribodipyrimidine photolyase related protein n=1 Tax=Vibrio crassostreae TaxID=246167 RepID=A0A822MTX1_9VIBR|nr:cryptochrome/photolyase family protein [Vibrio crassostreae]MDH5950237.1 cryptochrome/photolyase family protein [Vibrio crassostreae]TCN06654.1 deoxyribodipyrimidine photolyase-related protein [Vibrio crassostreae]TCU06117.1 deoxyribodipyrimidine photolyase-related protein [Vibrio crassostreae]CAK1723252.1 deoxyribodipyrimidine photolyase-related protein [Vibrio crassostreae]CAK1725530.1 deoxyribodipyrimidine photolyase-related protein [Vibrio crassostreae]
MKFKTVRLVLGDQLNIEHSWFRQVDDGVVYMIAELKQETDYVASHIQKVAAFFCAMGYFADELRQQGHQVLHLTLDDTAQFENLDTLLKHYVHQFGAEKFEYQRPDEYRLLEQMNKLKLTNATKGCCDTEHFLFPFEEIGQQFPKDKHIMMEHFYRRMRKRFDILLEDGKPVGGKWNYDANNRKKLKKQDIEKLPQPLMFTNDITGILQRIERHHVQTIGQVGNQLLWPVNRAQSLSLLAHFCQVCLPLFGHFQDAMTTEHDSRWSLYHSRISFSLNSKMLNPREVIDAALSAYHASSKQGATTIDIAQVEGFIRQILGWREYIRGVYWANMPAYANKNHYSVTNNLPHYFWDGQTKMNCMKHAIDQSLEFAYAHHIQRLMITGNFCLITGIDPDQVDSWYLGIYVDAIEWVEMPNTRGMALFADGGIVGTKPYSASGSYINRMSDYCKGCHYQIKERSGEQSCPFNSLYWRFMNQHRDELNRNPRMGMLYRSWDNMDEQEQQAILDTAEQRITNLENL